jgi:hypothetical protein
MTAFALRFAGDAHFAFDHSLDIIS